MSRFEVILFFHLVGVVLIAGGAGVGMAAGIAMPSPGMAEATVDSWSTS